MAIKGITNKVKKHHKYPYEEKDFANFLTKSSEQLGNGTCELSYFPIILKSTEKPRLTNKNNLNMALIGTSLQDSFDKGKNTAKVLDAIQPIYDIYYRMMLK